MATEEIDKIVHAYKIFAQYPSIVSAKLSSDHAKNGIAVQSVWSQKNLERCKKQKFSREFIYDVNLKLLAESSPLDISSEILTASSENEKLKAILREIIVDGKSKQFIEIWDNYHVFKSYDLSTFDVHGEVYSVAGFAAFNWSPDNKCLMYVAEKKLPKNEPFYKQKSKTENNKKQDGGEISKGTEYVFKPDWGEQLVGKHRSVVVILNIEEDTITPVEGIPDEYFPAQATWAPNGDGIVGVAYKLKKRYLGLWVCTNRESYIFHLKEKKFRKLTAEGLSCRSPRFSPDGNHLIWLEREISVPHHHVHRLMHMRWNDVKTIDILIDLVKKSVTISNDKKFYGLFNQSLPKRCWSEDSKYLFLSTPQRSHVKSYILDIETKILTEIESPDDNSMSVLDVKKNFVAIARSSLIQPPVLVLGKFDSISSNTGCLKLIEIVNCSTPIDIPGKEQFFSKTTEYNHDNQDSVKDYNFIYLGKKNEPSRSVPLIAIPHGGPHSTISNEFNITYAIFAYLGYGVLLINYRGSTGLGGDNIEFLLGKIGKADVIDCLTAINTACDIYPWLNPRNINLYGGSHGGFLIAHLSGQYPDMFKAVIMRNPVIDIAVMFSISDIPDWCSGQSGKSGLPETIPTWFYPELCQIMLNHSPVLYADRVKTPTLIALGSKDLRVPSSQGKLWYYRLCQNNVPTKLHVYDDNHSLAKDEVGIDFLINAVLWLKGHSGDSTQ